MSPYCFFPATIAIGFWNRNAYNRSPKNHPWRETKMAGQLCWLPKFGGDGQLVLHLRKEHHHAWKPYTHFPEFTVPDYPIPKGTKGWATSQRLLQLGWAIVPTAKARIFLYPDSEAA
jgi:hypothetical protein